MLKRALWVIPCSVVISCGNSRKPTEVRVDPDDYSTACAATSDCTIVNELACATYYEAEAMPIRVEELPRYEAEVDQHRDEQFEACETTCLTDREAFCDTGLKDPVCRVRSR